MGVTKSHSLRVGGEPAEGLLIAPEEIPQILHGEAQMPGEDFRLFAFSDSRFSHDVWRCGNSNDRRHIAAGLDSRTINWRTHPLPEAMLEELKRFIWTRFVVTGTVPTSVGAAKDAIRFLSPLCRHLQARGLTLRCFEDLRLEDLEETLPLFVTGKNTSSRLRRLLKFMAKPFVQKHVGVKVPWNVADIDALPRHACGSGDECRARTPLSSELFLYRSNLCRALVRDFLEALGEAPLDTDPNPAFEERCRSGVLLTQCYPVFAELYEAAKAKKDARLDGASKDSATYIFHKASADLSQGGKRMAAGEMQKIVREARGAAYQLITMYTGMRQSELKALYQPLNATEKERCIRCDRGMWFLYTTLVKGRGDGGAVGQDRWVAPDVIRDAVRVLELQQPLNRNPYLFSAIKARGDEKDLPYAAPAKAIVDMSIRPQLQGTKWEKEIKSWTIHTDRHTLVKELDAAGVQLVHISRQLHHVHRMLAECEGSEVTLDYGGIGKQYNTNPGLTEELEQHKTKVKRERYHAVLGEAAIIAGPGAEQLKMQIDAAFYGMGYAGKEREEYIDMLVDQGFPLPTSGFGVCGQPAFGMEDEPPCMGDYECDPNCKSCIVTEDRAYLIVKEFRRALHMQEVEAQAHNRPYWAEREVVFSKLLLQLGENPLEIRKLFLEECSAA